MYRSSLIVGRDTTWHDMRRGMMLAELLVVVALMALIFAMATPLYARLHSSTQLREATRELMHTITLARTRAVARMNDAVHGVYVQHTQYTLFQGATYAGRDTSYDRVTLVEPAVTLTTTLTGDEIRFSRGLGAPHATGTITLTHAIHGTQTITIDNFGSVH